MRELLFSVTRKDCIIQPFRAGGPGGQKQNKTSSGCRIIHPPSGAVGESRTQRSFEANRRQAWRRMAESPKFRFWLAEMRHTMMKGKTVDEEVAEQMAPKNLRIEVRQTGVWQSEEFMRS